MGSLTKIGFCGTKIDDITSYLSRILNVIGKKLAVIDASEEQFLKFSVPSGDNCTNITTYRGVDIYTDCSFQDNFAKVNLSKYEVVFINFGLNKALLKEFSDCDIHFIVTDMERHNVLRLKDTVSKLDKKLEAIRIYRDVVDSKIDKRYMDSLLENVMVNYKAEYFFNLDDSELACRIDSQYNDIFKFNKLPKEFKVMFSEVLTELLGLDKKTVSNAIKKAERGK
ncbi:MAG: hypothetical protein N3B21_00300 [Clostridia bacterium]|nr:hypothetical protein [Clostridia bacterium]